jgi:hypothetical protein
MSNKQLPCSGFKHAGQRGPYGEAAGAATQLDGIEDV